MAEFFGVGDGCLLWMSLFHLQTPRRCHCFPNGHHISLLWEHSWDINRLGKTLSGMFGLWWAEQDLKRKATQWNSLLTQGSACTAVMAKAGQGAGLAGEGAWSRTFTGEREKPNAGMLVFADVHAHGVCLSLSHTQTNTKLKREGDKIFPYALRYWLVLAFRFGLLWYNWIY